MTLVRWNPVRDLASLEIDRLTRMFDDGIFQYRATGHGWAPAVDIYETKDREFVIKAELPEMKREQITVTFENNVLTLSGERASESRDNGETPHRTERVFGAFARSFTLPPTVDGNRITAAYKDGVLTVRIPQREEAKPKQIAVGE